MARAAATLAVDKHACVQDFKDPGEQLVVRSELRNFIRSERIRDDEATELGHAQFSRTCQDGPAAFIQDSPKRLQYGSLDVACLAT